MVDIKKINQPQILPELEVRKRSFGEQAYQSWEFKQGDTNFNFRNGRILLNNQDLSRFISENLTNLSASYWTQLAEHLEYYRQWAIEHIQDPEQLSLFAGMVYAMLGKLGGRLKRKFDEKMDGIVFQLEDGRLMLNGINIHAFIDMVRKYPTSKAKIFLKGLKNRLGVMLSNRFGNSNYEKIREVTEDLFGQIDQELKKSAPEVILLPPGRK